MKYFDRRDLVTVRSPTGADEDGLVVVDTGGPTVVVTRNDSPKHSKRVERHHVSPIESVAVVKPLAPKKEHNQVSRSSLKCLETEHGWCALQSQARKMTQGDLVEGVWSMCGTWITSRSKVAHREPSCPRCRQQLNMNPL